MVVPAGLYLALQWGEPAARGWGIPMATDIAFVVGCMAVLGNRLPVGLRVMLLSLAIVDDIGAILVIAIGYTESLDYGALAVGVGAGVAVLGMQWLGVRSVALYVVVGAVVWVGFHESGVHATLAGVVLGLLTPSSRWIGGDTLTAAIREAHDFLHGEGGAARAPTAREAARLGAVAREAVSPLTRLEHMLHPWSAFAIMPLFAFANAGVRIDPTGFGDPVALAVAVGLFVGKPLGIVLASFLAVRSGLARLPAGVGWPAVAGAGWLAGIGFTMAMFIAGLALDGAVLDRAKLGILAGSFGAAVAGMALLFAVLPRAGAGDPRGEARA
jgi:NhaA family Na+:H+ antiporter